MNEYTSHEALKEWEAEEDENNLTQNIVALLGIHGMHCKFYKYQNASHITKAFEGLIHQELQEAREERDREIMQIILKEKSTWADQSIGYRAVESIIIAIGETIIDRYDSELDQPNK